MSHIPNSILLSAHTLLCKYGRLSECQDMLLQLKDAYSQPNSTASDKMGIVYSFVEDLQEYGAKHNSWNIAQEATALMRTIKDTMDAQAYAMMSAGQYEGMEYDDVPEFC